MGGQTALNSAIALEKKGILKKYKVELIGADSKAISRAAKEVWQEKHLGRSGRRMVRDQRSQRRSSRIFHRSIIRSRIPPRVGR